MREAVITIVETETVDGVTYPMPKVFRVEFEGDFGIVGEDNNTDTFQLGRVVNLEHLVATTNTVTPVEADVLRSQG